MDDSHNCTSGPPLTPSEYTTNKDTGKSPVDGGEMKKEKKKIVYWLSNSISVDRVNK